MAYYYYKAMKADGSYVSDIMSSENHSKAVTKLRQLDLFPIKVREATREEIRKAFPGAEKAPRQTYLEFLCENIGNKLIEWGNYLKK